MLTKDNGKKEVEPAAAEEKVEFGEPYEKKQEENIQNLISGRIC